MVVLLRPLTEKDAPAVRALHEALDDHDRYLRFFGAAPGDLAALAERMSTEPDPTRAAMGAFLHGRLIGVGSYEVQPERREGELALAVSREAQQGGVGTLLLEDLVSIARGQGLERLVAVVLAENTRMLGVLRDLGLPLSYGEYGSEREVTITLDPVERYLDALAAREGVADVASLRHVLRPRSVVVVGASRRADAVGHAVLANILAAGFTGEVHAVNRNAGSVLGIPCHPSVADLPVTPELAAVCVTARDVPAVVEDCGRRGVGAVVVVTSGLSDAEAERTRAAVREHGLRLVGPNCLGVANTEPGVRLNATFLRRPAAPGDIGLMTQSGGIAIALAERLDAVGLGLSTMVSAGDKYDVSGNDLLQWWRHDPRTAAAVLYLESFGNPRKFGRLARALAREKPVLAVRVGSSPAAQRAAASHTAATATPAVNRDALFEQAGVIAVDTVSELVNVLAALRWQGLPPGNRVAVLSNAGGTGVLAADACARHGLVLPELEETTRTRLRLLLPAQAGVGNPVDTTAAVPAPVFGACLDALVEDDGVDAVIVATLPTAVGDPAAALSERVSLRGKPVLVVRPDRLAEVEPLLPGPGGPGTASYADPEDAAQALGRLARYARWLREQKAPGVAPPRLDVAGARELVAAELAVRGEGGWLDAEAIARLLGCAGIALARSEFAADAHTASDLASAAGYPVAVKAVAEGLLHKSAGGGVVLGVRDRAGVDEAVEGFRARFGSALRGVLVQRMVPHGTELLAGIAGDEVFGPLVVFGLGGVDTDLVNDRAARLAPLSETEAGRLVAGLRSSPALARQVPLDAVRGVLLRLGLLADAVPEIAELDLNPLVVSDSSALALDSRVRLRPRSGEDPFLRHLRH
ncbi:acyl-CoA synthetase [Prauserella flavalba]|uniref:Acyl-CoA synthetase n=2 Tax=Prauserella flavalba TaxID=1477506 RepID=A0A318LTQ4_9PSEU|nr:GNAT family N-acetyltransferase [Prauserella flavalba]PXY36980.1 acyl-CoA synthetase [Prauserella flavalba]